MVSIELEKISFLIEERFLIKLKLSEN